MTIDFSKNLGKNIMLARKTFGFTQKDLAVKLGFNRVNISRIESGDQQVTAEQLSAIAQALNTTVGALVGESGGGDVDPSAVSEFTAWCDSKGFRSDKYHALALWVIRHLSLASLSAAMTAMGENRPSEFTLVDPVSDAAEERAAYETVMEEVRKADESPDKRRKGAG